MGQTKRPPKGRKWDKHKLERSTPSEVEAWLEEGSSLGCVCGEVSGHLLVLDFDQIDYYPRWVNAVSEVLGNYDWINKFPLVETKKGKHLYLRCDKAPRSEVLSRDQHGKIIIETRGEGGYVVFPEGHSDYRVEHGAFEEIPVLDDETLDLLLSSARRFATQSELAYVDQRFVGEGLPGDDYNNRTSWEDILPANGWEYIRTRTDGVSEWTRPGKSLGLSATTGIHGSDLLYVFTSNAHPLEAGKSYTKFSYLTYIEYNGDFSEAAKALSLQGYGSPASGGSGDSQLAGLLSLDLEIRWYEDGNGDTYVTFPGDGGLHQVDQGECRALARFLDKAFFELKGKYPTESALKEAIIKMERHAEKIVEKDIPIRVRHEDTTTYVDFGNGEGTVLTSKGWWVDELPETVYFKRPQGMGRMTPPAKKGSLKTLKELINFESEKDWHMILSWLTAAIGMTDGTYPILMIAGDAGAAKSTGTKILKAIADPQFPELLPYPRSVDALQLHAAYNYIMAYDNLSGISNEVSDALCTIASGTGFLARKLYTNLGRCALMVKRPIILNGIDNVARRNDFASRTIFIKFAEVEKGQRLSEEYINDIVERDLPKWRAAIYDIITKVKDIDRSKLGRPDVRLSDFASWAQAVSQVMKWKESAYDILEENEEELVSHLRETDLVTVYLLSYMENREIWKGTTKELYEELVAVVPSDVKRSKDWPDTLNGFGMRVNRAKPTLRSGGLKLEKVRGRSAMIITLEKIND
jgi:hypothetical protein